MCVAIQGINKTFHTGITTGIRVNQSLAVLIMNDNKDLEIISGDDSNLNISPVYEHINPGKPKDTNKKPENIVIPKEKKKKEEN